ncbi:hypothetical protein H009_11986 [Agrobacterium tumefaciens str. Cherry 2E-2-2]|nr:hypothetical protein H009_11986 [Agrobacterium tumefaciens str. Cherry 2E-2-2]
MISAQRAFDSLPQPHFAEPWQAKAFALTLRIHDEGAFTWPEWTEALSAQIHSRPGETDLSEVYFTQWLTALESLLSRKGLASPELLDRYQHAWHHAVSRTPHGETIVLADHDFHD